MKTTTTWLNRFDKWQSALRIPHKLEDIPEQELDAVLQQFFAELRKTNGKDYEPESLRTMLSSLDQFLRDMGKSYSILRDKQFEVSRKVLNGKAIEFRERGFGKRKNKSDALTAEEEEELWQKGVLGRHNPVSLNYTIFFLLSQHFGTRGCQEHHQLRVEDLKFVWDIARKLVSVEWVEGPTKTRPGELTKMERRLPQRLFRQEGKRCPVMFLNLMISRRPDSLKHSGPLYLRPLDSPREDIWYSSQPVGVRKIDTYMRKISNLTGLDCTNRKFTNHSI